MILGFGLEYVIASTTDFFHEKIYSVVTKLEKLIIQLLSTL
jgi:hypothetical protein